MTLIHALLLGIVPAALVIFGSIYVRARRTGDRASAQRVLYLLAAEALLLISLRIAMLGRDERTSAFIIILLLPASGGTLAAILLDHQFRRYVWSSERPKTIALILVNVALLVIVWLEDPTPAFIIIIGGSAIALIWQVWGGSEKRLVVASAVLFIWLLVDSMGNVLGTASRETPSWLRPVFGPVALAIDVIVIVVIARLVHGCLAGDRPFVKGMTALRLALAALLLLAMGYRIGSARVWDTATDGLGGVFLAMSTSAVSIAVAMVMELKLPNRRKLAARAFAILVPVAMWSAFSIGGKISPPALTEKRAERIDRAVQRFFERNDRYPAQLADLTPWYLWRIPEPVIIPGQTWCYEGSEEHYRLGYVYRQYFSTPASVRVHAAKGEPPDPAWACDEEAAKYPAPPGYYDP